jgi:hypothetical protein
MIFTKEEIQVILALIDRVQLSGKEAMTVAQLQSKLSQGLQPTEPVEVGGPQISTVKPK